MGVRIKASDLKYEYSETATNGDSPKFTGKPDSLLFNREEEYEVIPMLENVMDELETKNQSDLHKLEDMIENDLPSNVRKRDDVFDWLVDNF